MCLSEVRFSIGQAKYLWTEKYQYRMDQDSGHTKWVS